MARNAREGRAIVEIILIGFTLMIFGIPVILGIATFFIFMFGGFSAIVGTHGGKELDPEGAEIVFLASHPKFRPGASSDPNEASSDRAPVEPTPLRRPAAEPPAPAPAAPIPLRRVHDRDGDAT